MRAVRSRVVEIPIQESIPDGLFREMFETAPDALVLVTRTGEIVLLNVQAERQFGYSRMELLGRRITNILPDGLASATKGALELPARRKDGSEFPVEITLSSAGGIRVLAAIRDITVRKKADADLRRSNEELAQFACVASHDLQEPLRMVTGYLRLLSRRYKGKLDSNADEFFAFALDGAVRMQKLIHNLLADSHARAKGKTLRSASSEDAVRQALINLNNAVKESGALVTHDRLPAVAADEGQLIQLFQNLIGNAIRYQGAGSPRIHIPAVRNARRKWIFSVHDNGQGIDSRYFQKIFTMFQRIQTRKAGSGVGLAICKKIVERHGGSISVESQPGSGSTFRFDLAGSERR